ncbi:HNH endonuclease [Candidatus Bathyarchaeota archaeon]|nr:HNH endonuclease [Candidatus Bathyarchaeota archaeon]
MQKPIPGFPGYEITDDGRVWSCPRQDISGHRRRGKWLKSTLNRKEYLCVVLSREGAHYTRSVHRLVLEAFIGPCPSGMQACHSPDRTRTNNRLANLRWGTQCDNAQDAVRDGTSSGFQSKGRTDLGGEANGSAKLTDIDVHQIATRYTTGSAPTLAKEYGVSRSVIWNIARHKSWKHLWAEIAA